MLSIKLIMQCSKELKLTIAVFFIAIVTAIVNTVTLPDRRNTVGIVTYKVVRLTHCKIVIKNVMIIILNRILS